MFVYQKWPDQIPDGKFRFFRRWSLWSRVGGGGVQGSSTHAKKIFPFRRGGGGLVDGSADPVAGMSQVPPTHRVNEASRFPCHTAGLSPRSCNGVTR